MGYNRFQIGCVIADYDLFNATTFIQNMTYVRFGIILTQFYVNFFYFSFAVTLRRILFTFKREYELYKGVRD